MRDRFQARVYSWEDGVWMAQVEIMRWGTMRKWIRSACKKYKVRPPTLGKEPDWSQWSGYYTAKEKIRLTKAHKNPVVVLHEVSHHICDMLLPDLDLPDHNGYWLGIYQFLLLDFTVFHRPFLRASMHAYGLPFKPLPPKLKALRSK